GTEEQTVERLLERFVTVVERYVFCSSCRSRQPGAANFCMNCGTAIRGGERRPRYEYTELTIPIDLATDSRRDLRGIAAAYDRTMREHFDLLAEDGWHPIGKTDL